MRPTVLLMTLFALCSTLGAEMLRVEELGSNEMIRIEVLSSGCFHYAKHFYEIRGGESKTIVVSKERFKWSEMNKKLMALGVEQLGSIGLSKEEQVGLDSLFTFYRSEPHDGCTTVDRVQIEYRRDGESIGTESIVDGSCMSGSVRLMRENEEFRKRYGEIENWEKIKWMIPLDSFARRLEEDTL